MTTAAKCGQCGAPVAADAMFCARCGLDVSASHGEAVTAQMPVAREAAVRLQAGLRQNLRDATLGEYEILAELGRGGMATVFLAHDISLDRKVAIKVMAPHLLEGEGMLERFKLEARTAAQLSHPHIIPIYAVRETDDVVYFAMKFIEGRPLDAIIKKMGPLPIPMVKDILTKVGQALGYAHRRNVVHRDVKPGNIMIDEESTPIVADFGIAKVTQGQGLTMTGAAIGTPSYMSPEQCEGAEVTGASDQYSLGIVAFEMLTGQLPFAGDSAVGIMYKHCHEPLPPLEDFRPDCPPEVRDAVTRMLAKNPADRWPSMEAAVQKLGTHTTLSFDDPVRTQIIEVVKEGGHRELLASVRTPRSPIPVTRRSGVAPVQVAAPRHRGRAVIAAALLGLVLVAAGAVAVYRSDGGAVGGGIEAVAGEDAPVEQPRSASAAGPEPADAAPGTPPEVAGAEREPEIVPAPQPGESSPPAADARVRSVRISGAPQRLLPAESVRLVATGIGPDGAVSSDRPVSWRSSDPGVATVSQAGLVTALGPGRVTITAAIDGVTAATTVEVAPDAVASIVVGPAPAALEPGQTARLNAEATGSSGVSLVGRALSWRSSDPEVATVGADGVVTAVRAGTARITATGDGVSGGVDVIVRAARVDARTAIVASIDRYARALESGDIEQVRRAYPGMTSQQEQQLRQALGAMRNLRADLRVGSIEERGDQAVAQVAGTYTFHNAASRRDEQAPVTFRATFERAADGWRLVETR